MSLLNYTTKKEPSDTISEIQQMLVEYGVNGVLTEYDGRAVSSMSFKINIDGNDRMFKMPCNWRGVHEIMKNDPKCGPKLRTEEQAIRVAWRIIKNWIESQLAMVEVNMVTVPQVFLPYTVMPNGLTLTENIEKNPTLLLKQV